MLTGQASKALKACRSAQGELTPTPHTGPNSWPMIVVTPEASEASMIRGESRWTWVSTAPAVAIRPSPETMDVPVPTTTSTPSRVSGLPARPIAPIRPSRMPMDTLRMPRTASITSDVADDDVAGLADGGGLEVQPVAGGLAEAGEELVAGLLGVGLDPDDQAGVAEPDPVAGARAVDGGVLVRRRCRSSARCLRCRRHRLPR